MPETDKFKRIIFWSSVCADQIFSPIVNGLNAEGVNSSHVYFTIGFRNFTGIYFLDRLVYRIINYFIFTLWFIAKLLAFKNCTHVVTTNPFFAPLIAILFKRKSTTLISLHWDIFPDALVVSGTLKKHSIFSRLLAKLTNFVYAKSDANVFLGELLLHKARATYNVKNACIIPVGSSFVSNINPSDLLANRFPIILTYSGNLGLMHDIDTFVDLFANHFHEIESYSNLEIVFISNGPKYQTLKSISTNPTFPNNVALKEPIGGSKWFDFMRKTHVSLITIANGAEEVVFPSKFYSSLAFGHAILAVAPVDSDLSNIVKTHDLGWVISPGNVQGLLNLINQIHNDPGILTSKRINSLMLYKNLYSTKIICDQWSSLFFSISSKGSCS